MRRFAALTPQRIVDEVPRDAAQPGAQFFRFAQVRQLFPRGQKSFLRQVLALAQAAGGAVGQRTNERLILRDDLPEGIAIAGQAFADQLGIVVRCGRHGFGRHHITA